MRERDLFSLGGSLFYIGAFGLFCASFYWLWLGAKTLLAPLGALAPFAAAVPPMLLFIGVFYYAAPALTALFALGAWVVLALHIEILGFSANAIAYVMLLFAATGAIIIAADYLPRLNTSLPQILLVILGVIFIIPVTIVTKVMSLLGLVKKDHD